MVYACLFISSSSPEPGICEIWGDPHYLTFDQLRYDFQGDCEYTIVRDCIGSSFHLIGDNVKNNPSDDVSVMRHLRLTYLGNEYSLLSDGEVRVNDVRVTPPYFGPDGVVIVPSYGHVVSHSMSFVFFCCISIISSIFKRTLQDSVNKLDDIGICKCLFAFYF